MDVHLGNAVAGTGDAVGKFPSRLCYFAAPVVPFSSLTLNASPVFFFPESSVLIASMLRYTRRLWDQHQLHQTAARAILRHLHLQICTGPESFDMDIDPLLLST